VIETADFLAPDFRSSRPSPVRRRSGTRPAGQVHRGQPPLLPAAPKPLSQARRLRKNSASPSGKSGSEPRGRRRPRTLHDLWPLRREGGFRYWRKPPLLIVRLAVEVGRCAFPLPGLRRGSEGPSRPGPNAGYLGAGNQLSSERECRAPVGATGWHTCPESCFHWPLQGEQGPPPIPRHPGPPLIRRGNPQLLGTTGSGLQSYERWGQRLA